MVANPLEIAVSFWQRYNQQAQQALALIAATPLVSKEEFLGQTQPCDIVLTAIPRKFQDHWLKRLWSGISGLAQACRYSSAKIYLDHNLVAGYGFRLIWERPRYKGVEYQRLISLVDEALLLRVPGLTNGQQQRISRFVQGKFGAPFDPRWVIRSFWQRRFGTALPSKSRSQAVAPGGNGTLPLSCATIIAYPFFQEGIALAESPGSVWPIDFILSPLTQKVCRLDCRQDRQP